MLKYFCIDYGDQRVFFNLKSLIMSWLALFHLNTYGSTPIIKYIESFSAETDFIRQILTSKIRPSAEKKKKKKLSFYWITCFRQFNLALHVLMYIHLNSVTG